jgi:hypothetical protein
VESNIKCKKEIECVWKWGRESVFVCVCEWKRECVCVFDMRGGGGKRVSDSTRVESRKWYKVYKRDWECHSV